MTASDQANATKLLHAGGHPHMRHYRSAFGGMRAPLLAVLRRLSAVNGRSTARTMATQIDPEQTFTSSLAYASRRPACSSVGRIPL